jgi:hypothetical protein
MNGYQFTASLFQSLVSLGWPIAIVTCVLIFRKQLVKLLPLLKVKHSGWEASFRLDQAEQEAKSLPPPDNETLPPTPEEDERFNQIAKASPRAAILESRLNLLDAVRNFARNAGMDSTRPLGLLVRNLRDSKLIDAHISAILDDLRVVGNRAAHEVDADFSLDDAKQVRALTERVVKQLQISSAAASLPPPKD